ncbi:MAG: hypothetical protein FWD49_01870 [Firmicutes bacterium]|nr:hypothetical protein [Bacillota bacterium]
MPLMLFKDVVNRAIQLLGFESEVNVTSPSKKLDRLVDCANMVYEELLLEYFHLKSNEILNFTEARAYYSDFPLEVREILSVKVRGCDVKFTMYPLYVEADINGIAEVSYRYRLNNLSLDDTLYLPTQYTNYIVATGVVAEYYYRTGLTDEAFFYQQRYDAAISNIKNQNKL